MQASRWTSILLSLLLVATLAACGKHDDHDTASTSAANAAPDAATQAREDTESTAKCESHPLAAAMPPRTTISGLPFRLWDCTFNSIRAVYGNDSGNEVDISLLDTRSPDIDKQPTMQDFYRRTMDTQRTMTAASVQMLTQTLAAAGDHPDSVQAIGGQDYLPVVLPASTGEPIVIHVGARNDQAPPDVVALFKDRHVLTMEASRGNAAITGLDNAHARALYEPFIAQLHPERLP